MTAQKIISPDWATNLCMIAPALAIFVSSNYAIWLDDLS